MKIIDPRFKPAEFCRTVWYATPESGTELKQLLEPGYWTHVADKLRKGDRIEAVSEDGTWFAEFYVKTANKVEAHLALMRNVELSKPVAQMNDEDLPEYQVKHIGGGRFRVLRTADNVELETGFKGKEEAEKWLSNYLKDIAA